MRAAGAVALGALLLGYALTLAPDEMLLRWSVAVAASALVAFALHRRQWLGLIAAVLVAVAYAEGLLLGDSALDGRAPLFACAWFVLIELVEAAADRSPNLEPAAARSRTRWAIATTALGAIAAPGVLLAGELLRPASFLVFLAASGAGAAAVVALAALARATLSGSPGAGGDV